MIKGEYRLLCFFGYNDINRIEREELYDIKNDSEEMNEPHTLLKQRLLKLCFKS